jgi:hypothetical protein
MSQTGVIQHMQDLNIIPGVQAIQATHPPNKPLFMLNILRYRSESKYTTPNNLPPISGREVYHTRYLPPLRPVLKSYGATVHFMGKAYNPLMLAPEGERWDDVLLVRYPSLEAFLSMGGSEVYKDTCAEHRDAALEDWKLVALDMVEETA